MPESSRNKNNCERVVRTEYFLCIIISAIEVCKTEWLTTLQENRNVLYPVPVILYFERESRPKHLPPEKKESFDSSSAQPFSSGQWRFTFNERVQSQSPIAVFVS